MEDFEKIKEITFEEAKQILPKNIAYLTMNDGEIIIVNGLDHKKFDQKEKDYESWMEEQTRLSKMSKMNMVPGVKNIENPLHRIIEDAEENERNSFLLNERNINLLKERNNNNLNKQKNIILNENENNSGSINQGKKLSQKEIKDMKANLQINLNQKKYQGVNPISHQNSYNNYSLHNINNQNKQQQSQHFQNESNLNNLRSYNSNQNINRYNNNNNNNNNFVYNINTNYQKRYMNQCPNNANYGKGQLMKLCQGEFIGSLNQNNYLLSNTNTNNGYLIYQSFFRPYNSQPRLMNKQIRENNVPKRGINRYIRYNNHNFVEIKEK